MIIKIATVLSSLIWGTFFCMNNFHLPQGGTTSSHVELRQDASGTFYPTLVSVTQTPVVVIPLDNFNTHFVYNNLMQLGAQPYEIPNEALRITTLLHNHPVQNLAATINQKVPPFNNLLLQIALFNGHIEMVMTLLHHVPAYIQALILEQNNDKQTLAHTALLVLENLLRNNVVHKIEPMCFFIDQYLGHYLANVRTLPVQHFNIDAFFHQRLASHEYVGKRLGHHFGYVPVAPRLQPQQQAELTVAENLANLTLTTNSHEEKKENDSSNQHDAAAAQNIIPQAEHKDQTTTDQITSALDDTHNNPTQLVEDNASEEKATLSSAEAEQKNAESGKETSKEQQQISTTDEAKAIDPTTLLKQVVLKQQNPTTSTKAEAKGYGKQEQHKEQKKHKEPEKQKLTFSTPAPVKNNNPQQQKNNKQYQGKPDASIKINHPSQQKSGTNKSLPQQPKKTVTSEQKAAGNNTTNKAKQQETKSSTQLLNATASSEPQQPKKSKNKPKNDASENNRQTSRYESLQEENDDSPVNLVIETNQEPAQHQPEQKSAAPSLVDTIITMLSTNAEELESFLNKNRKAIKKITSWSNAAGINPLTQALKLGKIHQAVLLHNLMGQPKPSKESFNALLNWAQQHSDKKSSEFDQARQLCADWNSLSYINEAQYYKAGVLGFFPLNPFQNDNLKMLKEIEHKHYTFSIKPHVTFENTEEAYSYYGALVRSLLNENPLPNTIIHYLIDKMLEESIDLHLAIPAPGCRINGQFLIDLALSNNDARVIERFIDNAIEKNTRELWLRIIHSVSSSPVPYHNTIKRLITVNGKKGINEDEALINLSNLIPSSAFIYIVLHSSGAAQKVLTLLTENKLDINYFNDTDTLANAKFLESNFPTTENAHLFAYFVCNIPKETWVSLYKEDTYTIALAHSKGILASMITPPIGEEIDNEVYATHVIDFDFDLKDPQYKHYAELVGAITINNEGQALKLVKTMLQEGISLNLEIGACIDNTIKIRSLYGLAKHCGLENVKQKIAWASLAKKFQGQDFAWLLRQWQVLRSPESSVPTILPLFSAIPGLLEALVQKMPAQDFFEGCRNQHRGYAVILEMMQNNLFPSNFFAEEVHVMQLININTNQLPDIEGYQKLISFILEQPCGNPKTQDLLKDKLGATGNLILTHYQELEHFLQSSCKTIISGDAEKILCEKLTTYTAQQDHTALRIIWNFFIKKTDHGLSLNRTAFRYFTETDGLIEMYAKIIDPESFIVPFEAYSKFDSNELLQDLINTGKLDHTTFNAACLALLQPLGITLPPTADAVEKK